MINGMSDPRLDGVFITDVSIDRELAFADVYVSALEGTKRCNEVLSGIEHAQGFIRKKLSQRIELRTFPRLRFHWDPTPERAEKFEKLLATIHVVESEQKSTDIDKGGHGS
jgi:ribosome-binding factor A